jgi:hypothetical protein
MRNVARPEFLLVLLALLTSGLLMSQAHKEETTKPPQAQAGEQRTAQSSTSLTSSDEMAFLRGELAEMRDYDQHLLATVYWSLSGVFLVVVVVAGLNLFANYRVYERERESLRQEVNGQAKMLQSEFEQRFHKMSQSVVAAGQKQNDDLSRQMAVEIKKNVGAEIQKHRYEISAIQKQLAETQYENSRFYALYYESQNNGYGAFGAWIDNLEHMKNIGWLWEDSRIADVIERLLGLLKGGQIISYAFQRRLTALLEPPPPVLSGKIELLKSLLEASKKV